MKKYCILLIIFLLYFLESFSQNNVGIGTNSPDSNAILELKTNDKGVLIPRLTSIQRNNMSSMLGIPQEGLLVYDNDSTKFFFWDGYMWRTIGCGEAGPQGPPGATNTQIFGVNGSHSVNICSMTYIAIPDLTLTINLTDTANLNIFTNGGIIPSQTYPNIYATVGLFLNNSVTPLATQSILENIIGAYGNLFNWSFSYLVNLPPGTYTFDVRAESPYAVDCFEAGALTSYLTGSSLIIQVYY